MSLSSISGGQVKNSDVPEEATGHIQANDGGAEIDVVKGVLFFDGGGEQVERGVINEFDVKLLLVFVFVDRMYAGG